MNCQHYYKATETSPTKQVDFRQQEIVFKWTLVTEPEQTPTFDETFQRLFVNDPNEWWLTFLQISAEARICLNIMS